MCMDQVGGNRWVWGLRAPQIRWTLLGWLRFYASGTLYPALSNDQNTF